MVSILWYICQTYDFWLDITEQMKARLPSVQGRVNYILGGEGYRLFGGFLGETPW